MKKLFFLISFLSFLLPGFSQTTPDGILAKAVGVITQSKGVEARFSITNSGYSGSGVIKTSGSKFHVTLPEIEVWYNGKDLYTLNKNTEETTVVYPTLEELAESNPLAYVTGASKQYNVTYSTVKKKDRYVLELTPKKRGGDIKRITLTLRKTDYYPEKIVVEPVSGAPVAADIKSFKTGIVSSSNEFEYPKSKFPKYELVDLR